MRRSIQALIVFATIAPSGAKAQFIPLTAPVHYRYEGLANAMLPSLAEAINGMVILSDTVLMTAQDCGQANAFFAHKTAERPAAIILCTEMIDEVIQNGRALGVSSDQVGTAIAANLLFVLLHEVGHAVIRTLELPVLGREEDAVDQFAAMILAEDPEAGRMAADFWMMRSDGMEPQGFLDWLAGYVNPEAHRAEQARKFADEHSLNEQRYYNIVCWTYGANPRERAYMINFGILPADRAERCPGEYQQLHSAWQRLLKPYAPASGNPQHIAVPSGTASSTGEWHFSESFSDSNNLITCTSEGTLRLAEASSGSLTGGMSQVGKCVTFGVTMDNNGEGTIEYGNRSNDQVSFRAADCQYNGTMTVGTLVGTVVCDVNVAGQSLQLSGSWSARQAR